MLQIKPRYIAAGIAAGVVALVATNLPKKENTPTGTELKATNDGPKDPNEELNMPPEMLVGYRKVQTDSVDKMKALPQISLVQLTSHPENYLGKNITLVLNAKEERQDNVEEHLDGQFKEDNLVPHKMSPDAGGIAIYVAKRELEGRTINKTLCEFEIRSTFQLQGAHMGGVFRAKYVSGTVKQDDKNKFYLEASGVLAAKLYVDGM